MLVLSSAASEALAPGPYLMDARIILSNGQTQITDPVRVNVEERITNP